MKLRQVISAEALSGATLLSPPAS